MKHYSHISSHISSCMVPHVAFGLKSRLFITKPFAYKKREGWSKSVWEPFLAIEYWRWDGELPKASEEGNLTLVLCLVGKFFLANSQYSFCNLQSLISFPSNTQHFFHLFTKNILIFVKLLEALLIAPRPLWIGLHV